MISINHFHSTIIVYPSASSLAARPSGSTYLVLMADRAGMVIESDETNNATSIALPPLTSINHPPVVTMSTSQISVGAGAAIPIAGSFGAPYSSSWKATLDPGNGFGPVPLALNADHTFSTTVTYASAGIYRLTVTVTDEGGQKGSATILVAVGNAATPRVPTPPASLVSSVATMKKTTLTGLTIEFDQAFGSPSGAKFTLVQAGRDGRFGTKDDVKIVLRVPPPRATR